MSKLIKYKFSDLYEISSGISSTKEQAGYGSSFVSFSTVFNNYFLPDELPDLMNTTEKEQEIFSVKKDDIFITRTSETADALAMSCVAMKDYPKATFSGFVKRLRPKTSGIVYSKYIAFFLRSQYFRKVIDYNTIMTLRASFNEDMFSFLYLYLPEYEEQVRIGDLLYKIETKMRLNKKINDNLEIQLKTLYDYWFTQFDFPDNNEKPYKSSGGQMEWCEQLKREIPRNWHIRSIIDLSHIYQPQTISNDLFDDAHPYYVYGGGGLIGKYNEYNHANEEVIISCRGNCGNIFFTMPCSWITGNAMVVSPLDENVSKYYLYQYLKSYGVEKYISGSVQKQLTRENLSVMPIIVPPKHLLNKFDVIAKDIHLQQQKITAEITHLEHLRDFLLPMLMNGQATIED